MRPLKTIARGLILVLSASLLVSCSGKEAVENKSAAGAHSLTVTLSTTELVRGSNRLTFGIYRSATDQVKDAEVRVTYRKGDHTVDGGAYEYAGGLYAGKGLYLGKADLDDTGDWVAEVSVNENGKKSITDVPLTVLEKSATPSIGEKAPASENFVPESYASTDYFCSATPPCSMHHDEIKHTLEEGKPMLILFAAPGRCVSELCGPQLEVTEILKKKYEGKVTFIHVEIFPDPESQDVNPIVYEWKLPTEPWTFVVDKNGSIADKFEGPALGSELNAALMKVSGL